MAVFAVLFVIAMSLVIIRMATVALTLTGLSHDLARFQALSAFTGSGFTTSESEEIVNHPIRRRIAMHLMLLGNAGIVIAVVTVLLSFLNTDGADGWLGRAWLRLTVLAVGIVLLWSLASSAQIERLMGKAESWALIRWGHLEVHDYTRLLRVARDYAVSQLRVQEGDWLANHTLVELQLAQEGVLALGIERRDGSYAGAPRGDSRIEPGDSLLLYGKQRSLLRLDTRQIGMLGNLDHVIAVTRHFDVPDDVSSAEAPS